MRNMWPAREVWAQVKSVEGVAVGIIATFNLKSFVMEQITSTQKQAHVTFEVLRLFKVELHGFHGAGFSVHVDPNLCGHEMLKVERIPFA